MGVHVIILFVSTAEYSLLCQKMTYWRGIEVHDILVSVFILHFCKNMHKIPSFEIFGSDTFES